jgi:hypothetical protein
MYRYILIIIGFVLSLGNAYAQPRSVFTLGGNGGFETEGSAGDFTGNVNSFRWKVERSQDVPAYAGQWSLKCTAPNEPFANSSFFSKEIPGFNPQAKYTVKVRIFLPLDSNVPDNHTFHVGLAGRSLGGGEGQLCGPFNWFELAPGFGKKGEWFELYYAYSPPYGGTNLYFFMEYSSPSGPGTPALTFYIDQIEILEDTSPEIISVATITNINDVALTASGGFPGMAYEFRWGGSSSPTGAVRENLPEGTYNIRTTQPEVAEFQLYLCWTKILTINIGPTPPLCEIFIPAGVTGAITLDKFSGNYVVQRDKDCAPDLPLGCLQGAVVHPQLTNVVKAAAVVYSDDWDYAYLNDPTLTGNDAVERANVGKWREKTTYMYSKSSVETGRNYQAGRYTMSHFNWQFPEQNTRVGWMRVSEVTKYSPHGEALEERSALNVPSATKFGYGQALPYLTVQNGDYNSVLFESFENLYTDNYLEDRVLLTGGTRDGSVRHSGKQSLKLQSTFTTRDFNPGAQLAREGLLIRWWARGESPADNVRVHVTGLAAAYDATVVQVARSGEWALLEAIIPVQKLPADGAQTFRIGFENAGGAALWIDDVRIQPRGAEMTCYVYDVSTMRLMTSLDDQHFGLYYQYNAEGKLVRKSIETERGKKTVQETQYNLPTKSVHPN